MSSLLDLLPRRATAIAAALWLTLSGSRALAQVDSVVTLTVEPRWSTEQFVSNRTTLELELGRALMQPNERLALLIGTFDVSALLEVRGQIARYRPVAVRLPAGETEVVAYIVRGPNDWGEVGRFPLKVRGRAGLEDGRAVPSVDLSGTAQLGERLPDGSAPSGRPERDLTVRLGFEGRAARNGWQVSTQANAVGVTVEEQRLRWSDLNAEAPAVDLADYRVNLERGRTRLTIGNSSSGSSRHLISGFGSRGLFAALGLGSIATLDGSLMNGSSVVGWSNPLGLERPAHRIGSATLGLELLPGRPGALHVDISGLSGSLLPLSSFNQGSVTDAEESRGVSIQIGLSDPAERVKLSGGVTRSRFINPADRELSGDTNVVAVRPTTRTARFGELTVQLLRGLTISPSVQANLSAALRHERVDPLFRSVGAQVQSDVENDGLDINGSLGPLSLQAALARSRDNLGRVASILTTRNESANFNGALPVATLLGASSWFWPTLTASAQRNHQFGEGVPENGDFAETHVPDQRSSNWSAASMWAAGRWNLAYRWNQSLQDNRQVGREQADFRAGVQSVTLGVTGSGVTASIDLSRERQKNVETGARQRLDRVGSTLQWQPFGTTVLGGSLSLSRGSDPFAGQRTRNAELQGELSQGFNLYRRIDSQTQGRLYLRFARTYADVLPLVLSTPSSPRIGWSLNAGGSLRLY